MISSLSNTWSIRVRGLDLVALSCLWVLLALIINPVGEFPLNDDWSYSRAVLSLIEHGNLQLTGFTSMPLIAQVLWGALFCLPFGFSFTALRLSTLVLGLVGIFATYGLFREIKADRTIALMATMMIAINPLYFQLSFTFMTDIPFFTVSMLSFLFILRGVSKGRNVDLYIGFLFSSVAILIRQLGIVIPLSFAMAYLIKNGLNRKTFQTALVPTIISIAILMGYQVLLRATIGLPSLYNRSYEPILESATGFLQVLIVLIDRFLVALVYLGLFTLPFTIILSISSWRMASAKNRRLLVGTSTGLFVIVMGWLLWKDRTMPLTGNILFDIGLGPALLRDVYLLGLPHLPSAPKAFWLVVTAVSVFGGVLIIQHLFLAATQIGTKLITSESVNNSFPMIFSFSAFTLYSVLIGLAGFLDRYLIWILPLLVIFTLAEANPIRLQMTDFSFAIASVLLLVYGLFTLGATHDYLSWNRARWNALYDLMEQDHISYKNIDGGFEFNGWYAYDPKYRMSPQKSWWWVDNDEYIVSFGPIIGYSELKRYPYNRWIPFGQDNIFVLSRHTEWNNSSGEIR